MKKVLLFILTAILLLSAAVYGSGAKKAWPDNKFTKQVPAPPADKVGPMRMYPKETAGLKSTEESKADVILISMKWDNIDEAKTYAREVKAAGYTQNEFVQEEDGTKKPIKIGNSEVFGPSIYKWIGSNGAYWVEVHFYVSGKGDHKFSTLTIANYELKE